MHRFTLLKVAIVSMIALSCQQKDGIEEFYVYVQSMQSSNAEKSYFANHGATFYFQTGEQMYINGVATTLSKSSRTTDEGETIPVWIATPSSLITAASGNVYNCIYPLTGTYNGSTGYSNVQFISGGTSRVVLADTTTDNVLTLHPTCAIFFFDQQYGPDVRLFLASEDGDLPLSGNVTCRTRNVATTTGMDPMTTRRGNITGGDSIVASIDAVSGLRYVAIPLPSNDVSVMFGIRWTEASSGTRSAILGEPVTIHKGCYYNIPYFPDVL